MDICNVMMLVCLGFYRKVDPQHNLIMQIQGKNQVFTLVKERIFTTCNCTINFSELKEGKYSALLKVVCPAEVLFCLFVCFVTILYCIYVCIHRMRYINIWTSINKDICYFSYYSILELKLNKEGADF